MPNVLKYMRSREIVLWQFSKSTLLTPSPCSPHFLLSVGLKLLMVAEDWAPFRIWVKTAKHLGSIRSHQLQSQLLSPWCPFSIPTFPGFLKKIYAELCEKRTTNPFYSHLFPPKLCHLLSWWDVKLALMSTADPDLNRANMPRVTSRRLVLFISRRNDSSCLRGDTHSPTDPALGKKKAETQQTRGLAFAVCFRGFKKVKVSGCSARKERENSGCALSPGTLPLSLPDSGTNDRRRHHKDLHSDAEGPLGGGTWEQFPLHTDGPFCEAAASPGFKKSGVFVSQLDSQLHS